jgi:hypothetical protein
MLDESLFISDEIAEKEIELADGTKHVLFFKQLPNTAFERHAMWCNSADEDVVAMASVRLLVMGLCEADGKPAVTSEQAERIKRPVMRQMVQALLEVNGFGSKAKRGNG